MERWGKTYHFEVLRVWETFFTLTASGGVFAVGRAFWDRKTKEWVYERAGYPSNQRRLEVRRLGVEVKKR